MLFFFFKAGASARRWCCCLGACGWLHVGGTHQNNETLCGSALTAAAGFSSSPALLRKARRGVALNHSLLQQLTTLCKKKKEKVTHTTILRCFRAVGQLLAVKETVTPPPLDHTVKREMCCVYTVASLFLKATIKKSFFFKKNEVSFI